MHISLCSIRANSGNAVKAAKSFFDCFYPFVCVRSQLQRLGSARTMNFEVKAHPFEAARMDFDSVSHPIQSGSEGFLSVQLLVETRPIFNLFCSISSTRFFLQTACT